MYEPPVITYIGKADAVILGLASLGTDLDGSYVSEDFPFQDDGLIEKDAI